MGGQLTCCASDDKGAERPCAWSGPEVEIGLATTSEAEDRVLPAGTTGVRQDAKRLPNGGAAGSRAAGGRVPEKEDEDEEEDEEDEVLAKDFAKQQQRTSMSGAFLRHRAPVFAEQTAIDVCWKPPMHPKTPEQQAWLKSALASSFLFGELRGEDLTSVIAAFQEWPVQLGEHVIEQGSAVSATDPALFVLQEGKLNVFKDGGDKPVFVYDTPGQYFGDLALLYNAPRAATVVSAVEGVRLWCIDRNTYNFLVKDSAWDASRRRLEFLREVSILKGLTEEERATICDALQERDVEAETVVIRKGEAGSEFYVVESGMCEARKQGQAIYTFEPKSYFGELALIRSAPRAVDVVAVQATKLLVLDVGTFTRLLGPLEELMESRANAYGPVTLQTVTRGSIID